LIAVIFSVGLIVSAAIAVSECIELQDDLSSGSLPDVSYTLEYSWYFMLFSGVTALGTIAGHALAVQSTLKGSQKNLDPPLFDENDGL
jgi:hypothetical protein